jgi:hypothetical protein
MRDVRFGTLLQLRRHVLDYRSQGHRHLTSMPVNFRHVREKTMKPRQRSRVSKWLPKAGSKTALRFGYLFAETLRGVTLGSRVAGGDPHGK